MRHHFPSVDADAPVAADILSLPNPTAVGGNSDALRNSCGYVNHSSSSEVDCDGPKAGEEDGEREGVAKGG